MTVNKDGKSYHASLEISNVTVEDAGKYRVTAKNELGESNATISLNFDSKYPPVFVTVRSLKTFLDKYRWIFNIHIKSIWDERLYNKQLWWRFINNIFPG